MNFTYQGETFRPFDHQHNTTRLNERAVEIPIARNFISRHGRDGLEVGNVLGHYQPTPWRVVDKYEGPEPVDVFDIEGTYDWVLAVSTVEHVGNWPDTPEPDDPSLAIEAVAHLRTLGPLLITVPFDQNKHLDEAILDDALGADRSTTMLWSRRGWRETPGAVWGPRRAPHVWPSALWVGEWL